VNNDLYTLICLLPILEMLIIRSANNLSFNIVIMYIRVLHWLDICSLVQRFILNKQLQMLVVMSFVSLMSLFCPCSQYFFLLIYKLISSNNSITWDHYSSYHTDLNHKLQFVIQSLKHLKLNMLCANGIHNQKSSWMAGWSASFTKGLHQMMDSRANDLISSHQLQAQEHTS